MSRPKFALRLPVFVFGVDPLGVFLDFVRRVGVANMFTFGLRFLLFLLFVGVNACIFFLVFGAGVLNTDADLVVGGDADLVVGGDAALVEFFFPFVLRFLVLTGIYIYRTYFANKR